MEPIVKSSGNYANPYEELYNLYKGSPRFDETQFEKFYKAGEANSFFAITEAIENIPVEQYDKLSKEYRFDLLDSDTRFAALTSELFSDKEEIKNWTNEYVDEYGQRKEDTFTGTEYDYNKKLLSEKVNALVQEENLRLEQIAKDEWRKQNAFAAGLLDVTNALFLKPLEAAARQVDSLFNFAGGLIEGTIGMFQGKDPFEVYADASREERYAIFKPIRDGILELQKDYVGGFDVNGNATNWFSMMVNSLGDSLGRALPSMAMNLIAPGSGAMAKISQGSYYIGMYQQEFTELVNDPRYASVPVQRLILNSAIRTGAEYLVQAGLNKYLGSSTVDKMVFGDMSAGTAHEISKLGALSRVVFDAFHEGLEEVLQDYSGYIVNNLFSMLDEEFAYDNEFNLETMTNAFVLGALGSFGGSVMNIISTTISSKGTIKYNKGILTNWQLNKVMQDFVTVQNDIAKNGNLSYDEKKSLSKTASSAFMAITEFYNSIGAERGNQALDLLQRINTYAENAQLLTEAKLKTITEDMAAEIEQHQSAAFTSYISGERAVREAKAKEKKSDTEKKGFIQRLSEKFKERKMSKISQVKTKQELSESEGDRLDKLMSDVLDATDSTTIATTKDGTGVVKEGDTIVLPKKELETAKPTTIAKEVSERTIIEKVNNDERFKKVKQIVREAFKKYKGATKISDSDMVTALLYDVNFQKSLLGTANKALYEVISTLDQLVKDTKTDTLYNQIYKKTLTDAINGLSNVLVDYLVNQQTANFEGLTILTDEQKTNINKRRFAKNLANRILFGEPVTKAEWNSIEQRVNSMPLASDKQKKQIMTNLQSDSTPARMSALNQINAFYKSVFLSQYDGKTYLPQISIQNATFNTYAQTRNTTAEVVSSILRGFFPADSYYTNYLYETYNFENKPAKDFDFSEAVKADFSNFTSKSMKITSVGNSLVVTSETVSGDYSFTKDEDNFLQVKQESYRETLAKNELKVTQSLVSDKSQIQNITYIITNSEVKLSPNVQAIIDKKFNGENTQANRLYAIREYLTRTSNQTVVVMQDGTFAIADLTPSMNILVNKTVEVSKVKSGDKVSKYIKSEYLLGRTDATIKLTDDVNEYDALTNTVYLATKNISDNVFRASLLHEIQHLIQTQQRMNLGYTYDWANMFKKSDVSKILKGTKKLVPELFEGLDEERQLKVLQDFVYYCTGENSAYGNAGVYQQYIPFIIQTKGVIPVTSIVTPWGEVFTQKGGTQKSKLLTGTYDGKQLFDEILNDSKYDDLRKLKGTPKLSLTDKQEKMLRNPIIELWKQAPVGGTVNLNNNYKEFLYRYITPEIREAMLIQFVIDNGLNVSDVSELSGVQFPFIRLTNNSEHDLSVPINSAIPIISEDAGGISTFFASIVSTKKYDTYMIVGNATIDDVIMYFPDSEKEMLLSANAFTNDSILYNIPTPSYDRDVVSIGTNSLLDVINSSVKLDKFVNTIINESSLTELQKQKINTMFHYDYEYGEDLHIMGLNGKFNPNDLLNFMYGANFDTLQNIVYVKDGYDGITAYVPNTISETQIETIYDIASPYSSVRIRLNNGKEMYIAKSLTSKKEFIERAKLFITGNTSFTQQSKKISDAPTVRTITEEEQAKIDAEKAAAKKAEYAERKRAGYISNADARGTNFEFYIRKGKPIFISPDLQDVIRDADISQIEPELWDMIGGEKKGTLTSEWQIYEYMRNNASTMNEYTFRLLSEKFFKNNSIKTYAELESLVSAAPIFHAVRSVAEEVNSTKLLSRKVDAKQITKIAKTLQSDAKFGPMYKKALSNYFKYRGRDIDVNNNDIMIAMLNNYDGTVEGGGHAADLAKWLEASGYSGKAKHETQEKVSEDKHGEQYVVEAEDETAAAAFDEVEEISLDKVRQKVFESLAIQKATQWKDEGLSQNKILTRLTKLKDMVYELSDAQARKAYFRLQGNKIVARPITEQEVTDTTEPYSQRTNTRTRIKRNAKITIDRLRPIDKKRFLEVNGDIFDENLKLKQDVYVGKSQEELDSLLDRVMRTKAAVAAGAYESKAKLHAWEVLQRKNERQAKKIEKLTGEKQEIDNGISKTKTRVVTISDRSLAIDGSIDMPEEVKHIFETSIDKFAKTDVTALTEEGEMHMQMNLRSFIEANAEWLSTLDEASVTNIVEYFENMSFTGKFTLDDTFIRKLAAFRAYTLAYIYDQGRNGQWTLSSETYKKIENVLALSASRAGTELAAFKNILPMIKPQEIIIKQLAKSIGVVVRDSDVADLSIGIRDGDYERIKAAKARIVEYCTKQYTGRKTTLFDKLWRLQRVFMLSSPGTAMRNIVSNSLVTVGNNLSGLLGDLVTRKSKRFGILDKKGNKQYKIIGTQVGTDVKTFIDQQFLKSGLLADISDGLTKYDLRGIEKRTKGNILSNMIVESIKSKVFTKNQFSTSSTNKTAQRLSKLFNNFSGLIFKMLSDDRWVNKQAIVYFGKMLTEDGTAVNHGLTERVLETFAEAYTLAAFDYMHKPNFINHLEDTMRKKMGSGAFFAYKQLFPFASASWNWAVEALRYSPAGLVKSIIDLHRLEKIADKMDLQRQVGDRQVSSKFTEYLAKRNIGKGIIGSATFLIGVALAALGLAGIDKEDKEIKLRVGSLYIDISSIFGTSSIMAGIALAGMAYDDNMTFEDAFIETLNATFNDMLFTDLYNQFRYVNSIGEWLMEQPSSMLSKFVPNFIKTISGIVNVRKVKYDSGIAGSFEVLAVQAIPGLAYAFPAKVDPYTGENQTKYKLSPLVEIVNRWGLLGGAKIYPYNVSDIEKEAISYGVQKGELTGRYDEFTVDTKQKEKLNEFYGKLNKEALEELKKSNKKYKVKMPDGTYKELTYKQMSDEQKKSVITRIMNDNASIAKIYIGTEIGYKYYTTEEERKELIKLGIKNVYKETDKKKGLIK